MTNAHGGNLDAVPVQIVGIVRGREIDLSGTASLDDELLTLAVDNGNPVNIHVDALDGIVTSDGLIALCLRGGDVLELRGAQDVAALASMLLDRAFVMPELTRGLRSLGSHRGVPGAAHDRWFAPLLSARRSLEGVSNPLRQLELFDEQKLRAELQRAIEEIAALEAPHDDMSRRAVEAAIEEEVEPAFLALDKVARHARVLRGGNADTRLADWRKWVESLRDLFSCADESWARCAEALRSGL